jgi:hypothetical protein
MDLPIAAAAAAVVVKGDTELRKPVGGLGQSSKCSYCQVVGMKGYQNIAQC